GRCRRGKRVANEGAYRCLGMGTARRTRYAGAWRLWRPCIDRETPSTPCSTGVIGEHLETFLRAAANDRAALECLSRLRPPFAQERLRSRSDGRIALELKTAWHDGTRELLFEPLEFLERLAAMTPRPGPNWLFGLGGVAPGPRGARASDRLWPPGARAHGLDSAAGRRSGRQGGGDRHSTGLELGGPDAPGVWHRRAGVCQLWRPPTPDRHPARSRGHPEDPRAPRPRPLGTESGPRPTRIQRRRVLIGSAQGRGGRRRAGATRWPWC